MHHLILLSVARDSRVMQEIENLLVSPDPKHMYAPYATAEIYYKLYSIQLLIQTIENVRLEIAYNENQRQKGLPAPFFATPEILAEMETRLMTGADPEPIF